MEPADNKPYIRETIEKPRTPFWKKLLLTVFLALVFGAVAAITFVFGKNLADRFLTTTEVVQSWMPTTMCTPKTGRKRNNAVS